MSVLTLADAKTYLNITVGTSDVELQKFIDRAESFVSELVGPLTATSTTQRVPGLRSKLIVPVLPLISVTSVTAVAGSAVDTTNLTYGASGVIEYVYGGLFIAPWYDVVYQAGWSSVPEGLLMAVAEKVREFWSRTQRGSGARRPGSEPEPTQPSIFDDLIAPYQVVGFA